MKSERFSLIFFLVIVVIVVIVWIKIVSTLNKQKYVGDVDAN